MFSICLDTQALCSYTWPDKKRVHSAPGGRFFSRRRCVPHRYSVKMKQDPHHKERHNQAESVIPGRHQFIVYLRRCWSDATDAAVLLAVTIVAYTAILYMCKILWNVYLSTHTGQMFIAYFPKEAAGTSQFLQMDIITLSIRITIYSFIISITAGSICRLLYLARYIYEPFGFLGRTIACGLPLTALVASYVQPLYDFPAWDTTFVVVLPPTLSVYSRCFNYAKQLLPEFGDVKELIDMVQKK